jgi:glucokinase
MLIVGDIGGTKTLLALIAPGGDPRAAVATGEYPSGAYPGLAPILRAFLADAGRTATHACLAVPGPVMGGQSHPTNLPWSLSEADLARDLGLARVLLLNDLQATAIAIPHLGPADTETLNPGTPDPAGPIAVIAPGTGLGEAFLIRTATGPIACATEGGHASFAPTSDQEISLLRHLQRIHGAVSAERVCSGPGIANIFAFLRAEGGLPESPDLAAAVAAAQDPTPLIAQAGLAGDPLARAALDMFIAILGAEAGNLALKTLATGGVYLAGGIPKRVLSLLHGPDFHAAFTGKGRLGDVLHAIPIHVVLAQAALLGAAQHARANFVGS